MAVSGVLDLSMVDWHPPELVAVWLLNSSIPGIKGGGRIGGGIV
jgi:hypothetical protein